MRLSLVNCNASLITAITEITINKLQNRATRVVLAGNHLSYWHQAIHSPAALVASVTTYRIQDSSVDAKAYMTGVPSYLIQHSNLLHYQQSIITDCPQTNEWFH